MIVYVIIIGVLIYLINIFSNYNKRIELFSESLDVKYMDNNNINYGEYWEHMTQPNIMARGFVNIIKMKEAYKSSLVPIKTYEKEYITKKINELNNDYINYWIKYIYISKGAEWLEAGMPHTHDNYIIMHNNWFSNFNENTLMHEIVHIHQRKYPNHWYDLIVDLGFIYYDNLQGLENIYIRNRTNPDGLNIKYLWTDEKTGKKYWIGAVFNNLAPTSLINDINYIACEMRSDSANIYKFTGTILNISSFTNYNNFFCINNNNYHPNEIIAEYMTIYMNKKGKECMGYKIFLNHITKLIPLIHSQNL